MSAADADEVEVVRWYTHSRKFPKLIGRFHDGRAIPGGPYTQTQFLCGVGIIIVASKTGGLWAHFGLLGNSIVLIGTVVGIVRLVGKVPMGSRNPAAIGSGWWTAASSPAIGKVGNRRVNLPRPHLVRGRVAISDFELAPGGMSPAPPDEPLAAPPSVVPVPAAAPASTEPAMALSNVQRLLAASGRTPS